MGEPETNDVRAVQREIIARLLQQYFLALKEDGDVETLLKRLQVDIENTLERLQRENKN
jgi:hypothetical protein